MFDHHQTPSENPDLYDKAHGKPTLDTCHTACTGEHNLKTPLVITGNNLSIEALARASDHNVPIILDDAETFKTKIYRSEATVLDAVTRGRHLYGITTLFGGMANQKVNAQDAKQLQVHLIRAHDAGFGNFLDPRDVRASMIVRLNSLSRSYSGISFELLQRFTQCLNADLIPRVREHGSIGASGDLVPLATIAGAITGLLPHTPVLLKGKPCDAGEALAALNLSAIQLQPKAGLALINGTSAMAGMAARILYRADKLFALSLAIHALMIQALCGSLEAFEAFAHAQKPHPGQIWTAQQMYRLLEGSASIVKDTEAHWLKHPKDLLQDRYSIRCLPQYLGPVVEGFGHLKSQITTEINATTDNPLVDSTQNRFYHGGHFLGQYLSMGMDQLRQYLALSAKHLDAQIALLMTPEFSRGLPPSLVGERTTGLNIGLKALQIGGNAIVPRLEHLGNPIASHFPTHAEQYNQNINSQGMGACQLAQQSLDLYQNHLAISLIIAVQACDLRAHLINDSFQGDSILSEVTKPLYDSVRKLLKNTSAKAHSPLVWSDLEQSFSTWIECLTQDIALPTSRILHTIAPQFSPMAASA